MRNRKTRQASKQDLPFPETGLSPALQRTIKAKIDNGELDEIDHDVFEENLRKVIKNND